MENTYLFIPHTKEGGNDRRRTGYGVLPGAHWRTVQEIKNTARRRSSSTHRAPPTHRALGIYRPIITEDVVAPVATEAGFSVAWLETTNACQVNKDDVFCQSWSLLLLIVAVLSPDPVLDVPRAQVDKYADLLSFYKDLMELSTVCDELRQEYTEVIARHPDRTSLACIDPCMVVRTMAPTDMFDKQ